MRGVIDAVPTIFKGITTLLCITSCMAKSMGEDEDYVAGGWVKKDRSKASVCQVTGGFKFFPIK